MLYVYFEVGDVSNVNIFQGCGVPDCTGTKKEQIKNTPVNLKTSITINVGIPIRMLISKFYMVHVS